MPHMHVSTPRAFQGNGITVQLVIMTCAVVDSEDRAGLRCSSVASSHGQPEERPDPVCGGHAVQTEPASLLSTASAELEQRGTAERQCSLRRDIVKGCLEAAPVALFDVNGSALTPAQVEAVLIRTLMHRHTGGSGGSSGGCVDSGSQPQRLHDAASSSPMGCRRSGSRTAAAAATCCVLPRPPHRPGAAPPSHSMPAVFPATEVPQAPVSTAAGAQAVEARSPPLKRIAEQGSHSWPDGAQAMGAAPGLPGQAEPLMPHRPASGSVCPRGTHASRGGAVGRDVSMQTLELTGVDRCTSITSSILPGASDVHTVALHSTNTTAQAASVTEHVPAPSQPATSRETDVAWTRSDNVQKVKAGQDLQVHVEQHACIPSAEDILQHAGQPRNEAACLIPDPKLQATPRQGGRDGASCRPDEVALLTAGSGRQARCLSSAARESNAAVMESLSDGCCGGSAGDAELQGGVAGGWGLKAVRCGAGAATEAGGAAEWSCDVGATGGGRSPAAADSPVLRAMKALGYVSPDSRSVRDAQTASSWFVPRPPGPPGHERVASGACASPTTRLRSECMAQSDSAPGFRSSSAAPSGSRGEPQEGSASVGAEDSLAAPVATGEDLKLEAQSSAKMEQSLPPEAHQVSRLAAAFEEASSRQDGHSVRGVSSGVDPRYTAGMMCFTCWNDIHTASMQLLQ